MTAFSVQTLPDLAGIDDLVGPVRRLMRGAFAAILLVWAVAARADEYRTFEGHGGPVKAVHLSADGQTVLTASFDNSVGLWNVASDAAPRWLDGHRAAVNCVIDLPGGLAASGGDDFDVILWNTQAGEVRRRFSGHRGKVMGLAATPDGARLASASWDGSVRVWDVASGKTLAEITGHDGAVNAVAWSADGTRLYTAGYDGTLVEWDTAGFTETRRLASHGFGINVMTLNEAGGWLAYGALDGGTRVLDLATGDELADLTGGRRPILALAQSPGGDRIAVGDGEGYIMVVDTAEWRVARDFRAAANGPVWALDFTASGQGVIAAGIADEAYLWPLDGGDSAPQIAQMRRQFHVDPGEVPNGERQFLRKCSICHTLGADGERRAGRR